MSSELGVVGESALQFFGKMNASISHEINNILAIINENAGLLEDVILMEERGVPLDPEKLKRISRKVLKQVKRANGIIQNMNRFAHSVDETVKTVDITDTLKFMIILSSRLSDMKRVSFTIDSGSDRIEIATNPFLLQNIIWLYLDYMMNLAKSGDTVPVSVEDHDSDVLIRFSGVSRLDDMTTCDFPTERETSLLEALNGKLQIDNGAREIVLGLKY